MTPYSPYPCEPSPAYPHDEYLRPTIDVLVIGSKRSLPLRGILDTGSAECILPYEVLGAVRVKERRTEVGIYRDAAGQTHTVEYGTVDLQIELQAGRRSRLCRWSAMAAFDRNRESEALWGHTGFLDYFNVTFYGSSRGYRIRLRNPRLLPRPAFPDRR